jgi:hypothetical protein
MLRNVNLININCFENNLCQTEISSEYLFTLSSNLIIILKFKIQKKQFMSSDETNNPENPQIPGVPVNTFSSYNQGGNLITPNSIPVLVLGILSIVLCWCYGILSIVLGVIAVVLANAGEKEYRLNPNAYSLSSYKNLKAGKTCAIIGLALAGVAIICLVIYVIVVGSLAINLLNLGLNS